MTVHYTNGYVYNDTNFDQYYSGVANSDGTIEMYDTPGSNPQ